jgi:hypothetical protein
MRFRVMRFRARPAAVPIAPAGGVTAGSAVAGVTVPAVPDGPAADEWDIGRPTAESQRAGLDQLIRIAMEQAAARPCPAAGRAREGSCRGGSPHRTRRCRRAAMTGTRRGRVPPQLTTLRISDYYSG